MRGGRWELLLIKYVPDWLAIIAVLLSVAALVVAIPPLADLTLGRPSIRANYILDPRTGGVARRWLRVSVGMPPRSRLARALHITRRPAVIKGAYCLIPAGHTFLDSPAVFVHWHPSYGPFAETQVLVQVYDHPSQGVFANLLEIDETYGTVRSLSQDGSFSWLLPPDTYTAMVGIEQQGGTVNLTANVFVSQREPFVQVSRAIERSRQ